MSYLIKTRCGACATVYSFAMQSGEISPSFCAHCGSPRITLEDGRMLIEFKPRPSTSHDVNDHPAYVDGSVPGVCQQSGQAAILHAKVTTEPYTP